jgi:lipoprotein-releasing system permease protein
VSPTWFIAQRFLKAHRRRGFLSFITLIAVLGVMLGTAALIIALSVLDGFEREIKEKVVGFTAHIEVQGYQNLPLTNYRRTINRVRQEIPAVKAISPYAAREGMIRSKTTVDGILLKGIDLASDVTASRNHMASGAFLTPQKSQQIIIGRKLALRLNVDVGDRLVVFCLPRGSGQGLQPKAMQFELVGTYESGMAEFDDVYAYTNLADAQRLFQLGEAVTGYDILVSDLARVDTTAAKLQELLGYPHYARTVFQTYRNLFSWVELQKKLSPLLLSLIIIVATVNIIGTLLMFVLEKTRAIAILKSLGAGPSLVRRIFLLQGLAIGTAGVLLGNAFAYLCCWIQMTFRVLSLPADIYYMSSVPILMRPENFGLVSLVALGLCLLTASVPARAAASLTPVSVFRFG